MIATQQHQQRLALATMTRLLICDVAGSPVNAATCAMVFTPGVCNSSGSRSSCGSGRLAGFGTPPARPSMRRSSLPAHQHLAARVRLCDEIIPGADRLLLPQRSSADGSITLFAQDRRNLPERALSQKQIFTSAHVSGPHQ